MRIRNCISTGADLMDAARARTRCPYECFEFRPSADNVRSRPSPPPVRGLDPESISGGEHANS